MKMASAGAFVTWPGAWASSPQARAALRVVLALAGLFVVATGVNIGFGGIATLGLLGPRDFIDVVNVPAFHVQDSHVRFVGGVWLGVGLVFLRGAARLERSAPLLRAAYGLVFLGGLVRLGGSDYGALFGPELLPSLLLEVVGAPLLFWWTARVVRQSAEQ